MIYRYENDKYGLVPFEEWMIGESNYKSWFNDREVTAYNSHGLFPYTESKMKSFLASINDETNVTMAIYAKRDKTSFYKYDQHVGNVSLQSINWINRSAELAIIIGEKEHREKGLGLQVCAVMMYHAFVKLGLHRIWSGTAEDNIGMNKIFDRLGFQKEGVFVHGMWRDGEYRDINAYGFIVGDNFRNCGTVSEFLLKENCWRL